jgi:hypothetical protein
MFLSYLMTVIYSGYSNISRFVRGENLWQPLRGPDLHVQTF